VSERVPIGAELTCRISLDGHDTALCGRVAWLRTHTAPRPHGMGIRFERLPEHERERIAHVVERSALGYRPVELRFADLPAPIVARALPQPSGLLLSAALPILERGARLAVRLEPESPALDARIGDVRIAETEGVRRLEVEVELAPDPDAARARRAARYGLAEELGETSAAQRPIERTAVTRAATSRLHNAVPLALATAAGIALGFTASALRPQPRPPTPAPALTRALAPALTPAPAPALTPVLAPALPPTPAPALLTAIETRSEGNATFVRIPFTGSLAGMVAQLWARPKALALDLPKGESALSDGTHAARAGSVNGVRLSRRDGTLYVRVQLASDVARYSVTAQDSVLEVRLLARAEAPRSADGERPAESGPPADGLQRPPGF
jgi:hypothetical protein